MSSPSTSEPSSEPPNPVDNTSSSPPPEPPFPSSESHPHNSFIQKIGDQTKTFIEADEIRDAATAQEFLTQNTLKLIGKTYAFILIVLGMFLVVALIRESIVQVILPVITLIVGGVLGFLSKDILRGNDNNNNPNPPP